MRPTRADSTGHAQGETHQQPPITRQSVYTVRECYFYFGNECILCLCLRHAAAARSKIVWALNGRRQVSPDAITASPTVSPR